MGSLSGLWLTERAVQRYLPPRWRAARHRDCGDQACASHRLPAAYLEVPARAGLMVVVQSSDPCTASVAPHGGITPIMTPNPVRWAFRPARIR